MKKYCLFSLTVILACAWLSLSSSVAAPAAKGGSTADSGRLIVGRTANFGGITVLLLSIDGKQVASIPRGQKYDGFLTPGRHEISANISPNYGNSPPSKHTLDVQPGQTYSFTATWKSDAMVLVQNK